jgi:hypothetical protein
VIENEIAARAGLPMGLSPVKLCAAHRAIKKGGKMITHTDLLITQGSHRGLPLHILLPSFFSVRTLLSAALQRI